MSYFWINLTGFPDLWVLISFEVSILSHILKIKYIYLKNINLTTEIKHCIRVWKIIVYQYQNNKKHETYDGVLIAETQWIRHFLFHEKDCWCKGAYPFNGYASFWFTEGKGRKKWIVWPFWQSDRTSSGVERHFWFPETGFEVL